MKILLDGRLLSDKPTGISRYSEEVIKIYQNYFGYENVSVIIDSNLKKRPFKHIETTLKPFNIFHFIKFSNFLKKINYDCYHTLYYSNSFWKKKNTVNIVTVHDLMYKKVFNFFGPKKLKNIAGVLYYDFIVKKTLKNSDHIISVSNTTKEDIKKLFGYDSLLIPEGINKIEAEDKPIKKLENENFYLYVGNSRPHKNLGFLIRCFEKSETEKKLILVGTGNKIQINSKKIISLGFVSDGELNWLYKKCSAFILPSLYEGFGLPILEALNKRTKVFSSTGGALKEFPAELIKYFDPYKEEELIKILNEDTEYQLEEKKLSKVLEIYTWKNTEQEMIGIFKKLKKGKKDEKN